MSDSAPPPPPPEHQGGANPPPPPPPAAPPPPAPGYGGAPGYGAAPAGPRPGELLDRFLAKLIDLVLIFVVNLIIGFGLAAVLSTGRPMGGFGVGGSLVYGAVSAIISTVLYLGYFSVMESSQGRTIGKQIMRLRVTGPDGTSKPTLERAVKRNLWTGLPILGIIPFVGLLAYPLILAAEIVIAVTISNDAARRQSWFDTFAGGTQVLKEG